MSHKYFCQHYLHKGPVLFWIKQICIRYPCQRFADASADGSTSYFERLWTDMGSNLHLVVAMDTSVPHSSRELHVHDECLLHVVIFTGTVCFIFFHFTITMFNDVEAQPKFPLAKKPCDLRSRTWTLTNSCGRGLKSVDEDAQMFASAHLWSKY